ncbi:Proteolipid protein 2 [Malassezia psittaci]|uniref:Proteolipid protein 2 n=1 Tax=Malassezia psittaci TaxID=1821823 RepID=A0AAF0JCX8_9BASI|nr:Proteolipid protein 2 [Malassezia psittaci]
MAQVTVDPNQDTEFHDALRARGIIPEREPSRSPSPELPTAEEVKENARRQATVEDLDEELESADEDEERILLRLRRERMKEIAAMQSQSRFGRMYPISRPDYAREVTEASKESLPGASDANQGTGVVCFLYKSGIDTCELLSGYLEQLAAKYPNTKFVSIIGDQCIPDYPDKNLPTLLIYRAGELRRQIVGLRPEIGLDGMNTKMADIELLLAATGAIALQQPKESRTDTGRDGGKDNEQSSIRESGTNQHDDDDDLDWD